MNEKKQQQTTDTGERSNTPSHHAFQVRDLDGDKSFWTRIGSAWAHRDGKGFTIQLDAVPIDGRVTLRRPEEKPAEQAQASGRKSRVAQPAPV